MQMNKESTELLDTVEDYIEGRLNISEAINKITECSYIDRVSAMEMLLEMERDNVIHLVFR